MIPAEAFTRTVCEHASKAGYKLFFLGGASQWKRPNGNVLNPVFHAGISDKEALWEACCYLQQHEFPNLTVTID